MTSTTVPDGDATALILRLLLGDATAETEAIDWPVVAGTARRELVAHRLAVRLERWGIPLPRRFADAVRRGRQQVDRLATLAARIGEACERAGVPHVFLKLVQHYPDTGQDLDLLLERRAIGTDRVVLDQIPAIPRRRPLLSRVAGSTGYRLPESGLVLDVHHGRLGRLGEYGRFADVVLRRRRLARAGAATLFAPSREDRLLLQALGQASGRRALRLRDALVTLHALRAGDVDWDALWPTARTIGLEAGLTCHLDYADQVHEWVFGRPVLDAATRARIGRGEWGRLTFRDGAYRFPATRVTGRLYLERMRTGLATGDWEAAGRLCLVPVVAAPVLWRRLGGARGRT